MTKTPADLIAEYTRLEDWVKAETKRFSDHLAPAKARMEEIKETELRAHLLALGSKDKQTLSTDAGTAYTSTILTPSINYPEGQIPYANEKPAREAYLDWCLENWDEGGNAMLQLGAPQVTAVREYMDKSGGHPPPGVKISTFTRVNIKRS